LFILVLKLYFFYFSDGYYCDCFLADNGNTYVVNTTLCDQNCDQNCPKQFAGPNYCEKCGSSDGYYGSKYMLEDPVIPSTTQIVTRRPKRFTRDTRKLKMFLAHQKRNLIKNY
jgi:hypothetical protein